MGFSVTTGPATEPVTLAQIKAQCRVTHIGEDDLLTDIGVASRQWCENYTQRAFIQQTCTLYLDRFPDGAEPLYLPRPRLILAGSPSFSPAVGYYDENGDSQTLVRDTDYVVTIYDEPAALVPVEDEIWPIVKAGGQPGAVQITYKAGYSTSADDVPKQIKQAILMLCSHWYKYREPVDSQNVNDVPFAVESLLSPYMIRHEIPLGAVA